MGCRVRPVRKFSSRFSSQKTGALGAQGEHGDHVLEQHLLLAAEAAADAGLDHADLLHGDLQALGDDAAAVEGHLGAGGDDDAAPGVEWARET